LDKIFEGILKESLQALKFLSLLAQKYTSKPYNRFLFYDFGFVQHYALRSPYYKISTQIDNAVFSGYTPLLIEYLLYSKNLNGKKYNKSTKFNHY
jgi:hypothetical protein